MQLIVVVVAASARILANMLNRALQSEGPITNAVAKQIGASARDASPFKNAQTAFTESRRHARASVNTDIPEPGLATP